MVAKGGFSTSARVRNPLLYDLPIKAFMKHWSEIGRLCVEFRGGLL